MQPCIKTIGPIYCLLIYIYIYSYIIKREVGYRPAVQAMRIYVWFHMRVNCHWPQINELR